MRRLGVRVREHGRCLDMPFAPADFDAAFSNLARIAQMAAAFYFPNPCLPPWFHYTGPFHDGLGRPRTEFPWHRLTSEPLIYASMGTVQNGAEQVFRTIATACSMPGCQLVL